MLATAAAGRPAASPAVAIGGDRGGRAAHAADAAVSELGLAATPPELATFFPDDEPDVAVRVLGGANATEEWV